MLRTPTFQVANDNIIHDTIEGKVLVLNVETGTYSQLKENGVLIWNGLMQGMSPADLVTEFTRHYPNAAAAIEKSIGQFVQECLQEKLIAPRPKEHAPPRWLKKKHFSCCTNIGAKN